MNAAIAGTASGSYLVSKTPIYSSHTLSAPVLETPLTLPQPDWSLLQTPATMVSESRAQLQHRIAELTVNLHRARSQVLVHDGVIESTHAQLIIQNLHTKEKKKQTNRTKLFPSGKGRHLTAEDFIQELEAGEQIRRDAAQQKALRKEQLFAKKSAKEVAEGEWKEICRKHDMAVKEWEKCREELTALKVPRKE
ncbi:hypothetical protein K439DRAFT_1618345 [Ramaria rubella]|nr:hypothetical protein K439DRAFT_1618345 [Ramaria rubella]